jgi:hypothetical protein
MGRIIWEPNELSHLFVLIPIILHFALKTLPLLVVPNYRFTLCFRTLGMKGLEFFLEKKKRT